MTKLSEVFGGMGKINKQDEMHSCLCGDQNQQTGSADSKIVYHCPMRCEGDKTYHASGNCPDCKMHLVPTNPGSSVLGYKLSQVL